ncbi:sigma 54-interacting transcriptional regulator [Sporosarcina luteola]|uniref:sigma-54 interaction domain-containing protein n=1 Tax=Sporosarcina luteola TaxID=582850 RepID=UPI00203F8A54|nr:sigma 54-interacting transcriptional regulator [Sporosarcina luteola]MCM3743209.1 sigma 54-interacting transcriptional regulator [Sporosarcina luteola]
MLENEKLKNSDLTLESFLKILDYSSDEIYVVDRNTRIVYVNKNCEKHYGLKKDDVLGKLNNDFLDKGYWAPSVLPEVFEKKEPVSIRQQTYIGAELLTRAFPILNEAQDIDYIVITSTEIQVFNQMITMNKQQIEEAPNHDLHDIIIANDEKFRKILQFCEKIAPTDSTVLIHGESGTGKGVIAHHLHNISNRNKGPFLNVNCAAIPADLLESELFGYTSGSFTGANKGGKTGLFETADTGTIFLDEIGELALPLQAKVLQVIQDKQFIPIGSNTSKTVDIRIIAATNQDLEEMIRNKTFREDLYYRLNVIDIHMPTLAERKDDIIPLTYRFLNKFNSKYNVNKAISEHCLQVLFHYSWPGNVRQLENLMERLVITSDSIIEVTDLPQVITEEVKEVPELIHPNSLDNAITEVTRTLIKRSYAKHGSTRGVASDLAISQSKASRLIREFCSNE